MNESDIRSLLKQAQETARAAKEILAQVQERFGIRYRIDVAPDAPVVPYMIAKGPLA